MCSSSSRMGLLNTNKRSKYNGKPVGRGLLPKQAVGSILVPKNSFSTVFSGLGVLMIRWGARLRWQNRFRCSHFMIFHIQNSVDYRGFPVDFFCSAFCVFFIDLQRVRIYGLVQSRRWDKRRNILCRRSI